MPRQCFESASICRAGTHFRSLMDETEDRREFLQIFLWGEACFRGNPEELKRKGPEESDGKGALLGPRFVRRLTGVETTLRQGQPFEALKVSPRFVKVPPF